MGEPRESTRPGRDRATGSTLPRFVLEARRLESAWNDASLSDRRPIVFDPGTRRVIKATRLKLAIKPIAKAFKESAIFLLVELRFFERVVLLRGDVDADKSAEVALVGGRNGVERERTR